MNTRQRYSYPVAVGDVTLNPARDRKHARRIMTTASDRACQRGEVYRCKFDGTNVRIVRAA